MNEQPDDELRAVIAKLKERIKELEYQLEEDAESYFYDRLEASELNG